MLELLRTKFVEALKSMAPLLAVAGLLQITLVQAPADLFLQFLVGTSLAVMGMTMLFMGIDLGILPMGRFIGAALPKRGSMTLIVAVAFSMGFATTVAEPDVLVLASQAGEASKGAFPVYLVIYVVAFGVGVFAAVAITRIILGVSMASMLAVTYTIMIFVLYFTPATFVPLAFDAGSATTGILTAPVMIALTIGLSSVLAGRSAASDGFGLLGFASIGPIFAIMILGMLLR